MWPDRVSNPGPLTYESGALPTVLRDPAAPEQYNRLQHPVLIGRHSVTAGKGLAIC